jgi:predicted ester cyclase
VIEEMVGEGDKVFSRFTWHGTHGGEFFGVSATDRQITFKGMVVDRVVAGKMVDSRILMDSLGMMTQLGVIPSKKAIG